ncbi:MAG TPA: Mu transposase C-terminal domain-containing protein, partial [Jatrophihabitans sp.]|nr:Mu transposase C-terminal domain-containing protein [Jatrophihabitans sp.]
ELLPATWRVINAYGIKMNRRTYDCAALNPHRGQSSGVAAQKGRWEIHYDPYDVTRVWVRNHHDGGWITVAWTHLRNTPTPFGEAAWSQAREILSRRGSDPVTETEIAGAVEALLDKAEHGPEPISAPKPARTKRDRRVAARTRATTEPAWPRPVADPEPESVDSVDAGSGGEDDGLATVIPLAVFDAREEAKKWW